MELPNNCRDYITKKEQNVIIKYLLHVIAVQNILKAKEELYYSEITKS